VGRSRSRGRFVDMGGDLPGCCLQALQSSVADALYSGGAGFLRDKSRQQGGAALSGAGPEDVAGLGRLFVGSRGGE